MERLLVLLAAAALGLPACATITTGTSQSLSVMSEPPGASCRLERGGEVIGVAAPTPTTLQVSKSMRDISVACAQPGYESTTARVPSGFQPMFLGNLLLGGLIGMTVDLASGAAGSYPASTTVAMQPTGGIAPTLPPVVSGAPTAPNPIRLVSSTTAATTAAPADIAARRKLLVRVDHVPAATGRGVVVMEVLPGGVGSAAGLQPGDVITALDGAPIASVEDMRQRLGAVGPNGTVVATVRRNGADRSTPLRF